MPSLTLSFYGVNVLLNSDDAHLVENIQRDFSFFKSGKGQPHLTLDAFHREPAYETLAPMEAAYLSPRNVCYWREGLKYIDYSGNALSVYNGKESLCRVYSLHPSLLHEICYMVILSLASEQLDKRHIHRIHALGLAAKNKAILILLDMGGGKSTLAMSVLPFDERLKLISEDSPLVDSKGRVLPFPLRIGLHPEDVPRGTPQAYQRNFQTQEFGPKVLIDIERFAPCIQTSPSEPSIVMIGRRVLGRPSEIRPASRLAALKELIKNSVVGVGLYQGIEYVFQKGVWEVIKKIPLGLSRFNNAAKVLNQSRAFEFLLGRDKEENARVLLDFLGRFP